MRLSLKTIKFIEGKESKKKTSSERKSQTHRINRMNRKSYCITGEITNYLYVYTISAVYVSHKSLL